jgi:exopolysaccharide biosynthesis polyprenyl glycosylphosphotransferase
VDEVASRQVIGEVEAERSAGYEAAPVSMPRGAPIRRRWWRDALRRRFLTGADLIATAIAAGVAVVPVSGTLWSLAFLPLWVLVAKLFGLYDRDHRALRHLTADEVPMLIAWGATITAMLALLLPLTPAGELGGGGAAKHLVIAVVAAVALRSFARWAWWRRTPPEKVGLLGDGPGVATIRRKFGLFRDMHFELATEREIDRLPRGDDREEALRELADQVDRIVVAAGVVDTELIGAVNAICRERQVKLSVVSPLRGRALPASQIAQVADLPILEFNTWDPSRSTLMIKRIFDVGVASFGLLLFLPLFPLIALAIKLDSRGPVLFSQIRAGIGGQPFRMYKLRTMAGDAERRLEEVVDIGNLEEPAFKLRRDPRVTRVGALLRRLSIDELPQLFNVLVGEMSIVGPRPEQVELVDRYSNEDRLRLMAKPGITGPMQVFGRGELTFAERLAVELEYVENLSLARDLRIILHTVPAVWRGTGAF